MPKIVGDVTSIGSAVREYNVRNYGAVGDGVADDATAIQAAITAASTGSVVYFPQGTYLIGTQITVTKSLTFAPGATVKKKSTFTASFGLNVTAANITITGLVLDGNRTGGALGGGVQCNNVDACLLINCKVYRHKGVGVNAVGSSAVLTCRGCESSENDGGAGFGANGDGFFVDTGARGYFYDCLAFENNRWGFAILNPSSNKGSRLDGCIAENSAVGFFFGGDNINAGTLTIINSNQFGIKVGDSSAAYASSKGCVDAVIVRGSGIGFTRRDGVVVSANASGTDIELYGAADWTFGTITSHAPAGYCVALAGNGSGVGSLRCRLGLIMCTGAADPVVAFAGDSSHNYFGTLVAINVASVAVAFGEGAGAQDHNVFDTILAYGCSFGILIALGAANNRFNRIISNDCYTTSPGTIPALLWFTGAATTGNRVGYFDHITNANPAPSAYFSQTSSAASNVIESSQGPSVITKAGVPTDADLKIPRDGAMVLDTTNHRLYIRDGGVWKYTALT